MIYNVVVKLKKALKHTYIRCYQCFFLVSGYQDSNLGPPAPKAGDKFHQQIRNQVIIKSILIHNKYTASKHVF